MACLYSILLEILLFPDALKKLTYEYYSGDVMNDLSQEFSRDLEE